MRRLRYDSHMSAETTTLPAALSEPVTAYDQALAFLEALDVSAMKLGLSRIQRLLATLDDPQDQLPTVHIAGTNGKGSTTAMLSAVLKQAGYKVGTFTSPHLLHVRERIAISGNNILPDDLQNEIARLQQHLLALDWPADDWPTYFECLNVLAYQYFKRKQVDVAVIETGLGGRLDSTNVVKHPILTVITGIAFDHMAHLGDTLAAIAGEKAGIIKEGTPLVIGPDVPQEALQVIVDQALERDAIFRQADAGALALEPSDAAQGLKIHNTVSGQHYTLSLPGPYQKANLATVLECVTQLRQQGYNISEEAVREGLAHTYWPARFQYVESEGLLIDGSHNAQGFAALEEGLRFYFADRPIVWLLSLRTNREPQSLVDLLAAFPHTQGVVTTMAYPEHLYHPPEVLAQAISAGLSSLKNISHAQTPTDAFALLREQLQAESAALGVVTGSLYTAGEILHCLQKPSIGTDA